MALNIGIVGLPNVGKSTLFNALTANRGALAANYPFATIDPNIGIVEVPDPRMKKLSKMVSPEKEIPATVEFHDIAGLVKGASRGEGLGNKFLAHIRECDAIMQIIRVFEDGDIIHVHGSVDAKRDIEVIQTELLIADQQTLQKRLDKARSNAKTGKKEELDYLALLEKINENIQNGTMVKDIHLTDDERVVLRDLFFLTAKPMMYVANVRENDLAQINVGQLKKEWGIGEHDDVIPICAKTEEELIDLGPEDAAEYLREIGIQESGLNTVIRKAYELLNLMTYFTAGPKEVHAWTIPRGIAAPQAAGVIHTDFEKGFIRAEVVSYEDYILHGGEQGAREKGKMRVEGKDYIVQDGDIMHFRFNN